jgi:hypothetical protein
MNCAAAAAAAGDGGSGGWERGSQGRGNVFKGRLLFLPNPITLPSTPSLYPYKLPAYLVQQSLCGPHSK